MNPRSNRAAVALGVTMLGAAGLLLASLGSAQADPPSSKLQREMRMFERVMDDMLIDSPNWLVPGRENTRGDYVPGYGVLFTFQATLVDRDWGRKFALGWGWWDEDRRRDRDLDEEDRADRREERDRYRNREERLYERGRSEIVDVFLDFADTFDSLPGNESIVVVAHLGDADLFWDKEIRRLKMTAKASDLKSYASGSLSDEEMETRIQVEEY